MAPRPLGYSLTVLKWPGGNWRGSGRSCLSLKTNLLSSISIRCCSWRTLRSTYVLDLAGGPPGAGGGARKAELEELGWLGGGGGGGGAPPVVDGARLCEDTDDAEDEGT